ncbi:hypothetical protein GALLN_00177 [Gallionellaceae bacterium]|nr:hypothetical protein GALLN_00177 [Gallionellaceae bacterium]
MATVKAKVTAKNLSTTKAPAVEKKAIKPVVKPAARKPVNPTPAPAAEKPGKKPKVKVVRDFSILQLEYQKIVDIKEACLKAGLRVKRSEVLRAGLKVLSEMNAAQIRRVIRGLAKTKIGLPKKP